MSVLVYFHCENGRLKKIKIEIKPADGDPFGLIYDSPSSLLKFKDFLFFLRQSLKMRRQILLAERVSLGLFEVTEEESKELFKEEIEKDRIKEIILAKARKFFPQPA